MASTSAGFRCNQSLSHSTRYYQFACGVTRILGVSENDVVYCTLPLYHTNGGILSSGQMVLAGSTLVLRKKFSASNFWTDCIKHKCTVSPIASS